MAFCTGHFRKLEVTRMQTIYTIQIWNHTGIYACTSRLDNKERVRRTSSLLSNLRVHAYIPVMIPYLFYYMTIMKIMNFGRHVHVAYTLYDIDISKRCNGPQHVDLYVHGVPYEVLWHGFRFVHKMLDFWLKIALNAI